MKMIQTKPRIRSSMRVFLLVLVFGLCASQKSGDNEPVIKSQDWYSVGFYKEHKEWVKQRDKNREAYAKDLLRIQKLNYNGDIVEETTQD